MTKLWSRTLRSYTCTGIVQRVVQTLENLAIARMHVKFDPTECINRALNVLPFPRYMGKNWRNFMYITVEHLEPNQTTKLKTTYSFSLLVRPIYSSENRTVDPPTAKEKLQSLGNVEAENRQ